MNDPHVESLEYKFVTDGSRVFENPAPLHHETPDFKLCLFADGRVSVEMKTHYATAQDARALVGALLIGWEIAKSLQNEGRHLIRFEFQNAKVIDRQPPPPGSPIELRASVTIHVGMSSGPRTGEGLPVFGSAATRLEESGGAS